MKDENKITDLEKKVKIMSIETGIPIETIIDEYNKSAIVKGFFSKAIIIDNKLAI